MAKTSNTVQTAVVLGTKQKKSIPARLKKEMYRHWELYAMLLIPITYIIVFSYIPMGGILIAFQDYSIRRGIWGSKFVGLKYFKQFISTPLFFQLLRNTVSLSLYSLIASFPVPIILALFLNEIGSKFYKKTVQMITFAPHFISTVIMVSILMQFLHVRNGFVNNLLGVFGLDPINFFGNPTWFGHLYVWSGVWQGMGYSAIIYISALSGIDQSMTEAAIIDGVSRFQRVRYIDLPTIAPTIIILLIMSVGRVLGVGFEKVYLLQNPINLDRSEVISTFVYKRGLENAQYSYSTAVGFFNSIVNLILIMAANKIAKTVSETSLW